MVSVLGKLLRKWRIDKGVSMRSMAKSLDITTSYLSAVELKKKKASEDLITKIITYFDLDDEQVTELHDAAAISNDVINIDITDMSFQDQEGVLAFARKYNNLSDERRAAIRRMLDEED